MLWLVIQRWVEKMKRRLVARKVQRIGYGSPVRMDLRAWVRRLSSGPRVRFPVRDVRGPFCPPEDWHEPTGRPGYRIVVQPPGPGYRHVLTPEEIRHRLAQLPSWMVQPLEVVQLSRLTRKKRSFPCYGMQWGRAIYLYPMEEDLVEVFPRPPKPAQWNEARMYGGRWEQDGTTWRLHWTEESIKDFYLNNILIHELAHLLDQRNRNWRDRERFAEWFAIHWGYRPTLEARRARLRAQGERARQKATQGA